MTKSYGKGRNLLVIENVPHDLMHELKWCLPTNTPHHLLHLIWLQAKD
jgi:hypothetical protein